MRAMRIQVAIVVSVLAGALAAGEIAAAPVKGQQNGALTPEQVRELVERLRVNQHRNDTALAEYERQERRYAWKHDEQKTITEDKTYRVVPTGTGTLKLLLEEKGRRVTDETYKKELRELERVLQNALNPQESRQRQAVEKWERRSRERREMVDAVPQAFLVSWAGREPAPGTGRTCVKLLFEPNPKFTPDSRNEEIFPHVRATVWIDETEAQAVRVEAEITRDIGVFGGVFGKIYKGGTFLMEQARVADGVWLPSRYEFDFDGRRFVFPFSVNETTEITAFRRVGPPAEALALVRREIQNGARPAAANPSK